MAMPGTRAAKVPPQPGLRHDFTTQLVRLGHARGMKVMGYFCVAANTRWGKEHPDLSYGTPATFHLPLTDAYLDYLAEAITDALRRTRMDGFMVDWLWNPSDEARQQATSGKWLKAEQELYTRLTGKPFPAERKADPGRPPALRAESHRALLAAHPRHRQAGQAQLHHLALVPRRPQPALPEYFRLQGDGLADGRERHPGGDARCRPPPRPTHPADALPGRLGRPP